MSRIISALAAILCTLSLCSCNIGDSADGLRSALSSDYQCNLCFYREDKSVSFAGRLCRTSGEYRFLCSSPAVFDGTEIKLSESEVTVIRDGLEFTAPRELAARIVRLTESLEELCGEEIQAKADELLGEKCYSVQTPSAKTYFLGSVPLRAIFSLDGSFVDVTGFSLGNELKG